VVRRALDLAGAPRAADLADVEHVLWVCRPDGPAAAEAAGLRVERFSRDAVLLTRPRASAPAAVLPLAPRALAVPGAVDVPELGAGCRLTAEWPIRQEGRRSLTRGVALKGSVPVPLTVRSRRPGDRVRPVGLGGTKKLQDLLVDRKVPRAERDGVPVVVDATGRIVWVVGHAVDAEAAAVATDDDVIVLSFERPAVSGSEGS
jgi:tRNA(Ile)-lysidine synthase